jgi:Flp pilus assembly protein TadB
MTNETDLHAANHVPHSGLGRSLVYYYFVLILLFPVILFGVSDSTLKLGLLALIVCAAVAPPVYVLQKKRRVHALRQAQVVALRKNADK